MTSIFFVYHLSIVTHVAGPYWFMLSIADFAIVQLFTVAAVYVTHRTEGISSLASFKSPQRRDLWSVIIVYEFSAIVAVSFDAIARFGKCTTVLCLCLPFPSELLSESVPWD
jgi:hypothetical protein